MHCTFCSPFNIYSVVPHNGLSMYFLKKIKINKTQGGHWEAEKNINSYLKKSFILWIFVLNYLFLPGFSKTVVHYSRSSYREELFTLWQVFFFFFLSRYDLTIKMLSWFPSALKKKIVVLHLAFYFFLTGAKASLHLLIPKILKTTSENSFEKNKSWQQNNFTEEHQQNSPNVSIYHLWLLTCLHYTALKKNIKCD